MNEINVRYNIKNKQKLDAELIGLYFKVHILLGKPQKNNGSFFSDPATERGKGGEGLTTKKICGH